MATGGTCEIPKGYEGHRHSVKRFGYDVLYLTLSKCGLPETRLEVELDDEKNNYSHPNYVISVHHGVICIALRMRDTWKRMFESKQKSYALNDMRKVEKYLVNIEALLEFRTEKFDKIRRSLAFYSELVLFLHCNNLEVDFGKLLDMWCSYFNENIADDCDSQFLLEAIFVENDDILFYLGFIDRFIEEVAKPYGKANYVSVKFKDVCVDIENSKREARADVGKLTRRFHDTHLESNPQNPIAPSSKAVKKSVSFPAIPKGDSALSGKTLTSSESRIRPRIVFSPRLTSTIGAQSSPIRMKIISEKLPREKEDQDSVLSGQRKYFEKPSAMAAEGKEGIPKGCEAQKYSIKRFAYDILHITLSKCGFPKTHMQVKLDDKPNNYCDSEYVLTVYTAVIGTVLAMRDKWKRMFEYKQKSYVLNDMQRVEKYLINLEVLPEFAGEGELYKIWRTLAFYSELILFLHHNSLEVDFEKLLDIWSNYFNEKIAVKYESDVLLEGLFITDYDVPSYVNLVDGFLQEFAIPYGKVANVSKRFRDFSEEVEKVYEGETDRAEERRDSTVSRLGSPLRNLPEVVEESVSVPSAKVRSDSVSSDNRTSPELS